MTPLNITKAISATPLIHVPEIDRDLHLKIEYENPVAAMKYRAIPTFIQHIIRSGEVPPGKAIAMRSAGSAAVAMAWTALQEGVKPIAVLPPVAPKPIVRMLHWLGAEVHIVKSEVAASLIQDFRDSGTYIFGQAGESRLLELYEPVGREIFAQMPTAEAVTVGIGTGISATGIARALQAEGAATRVYGCEPAESPVASGGKWAPHRIPGLAPPIPQPLLDKSILGGIELVGSQDAWDIARRIGQKYGLLLGPSSGCTVQAALQLREKGITGPLVAVCACSISEYLNEK